MDNDKLRDKTKELFIEALQSEKSYGSISKACNVIGRSRQTIYDWRKYDGKFNKDIEEALITGKSLLADLAEEGLIRRIKADDTTAIIFTLKSLQRNHYGEKVEKKEEEGVSDPRPDGKSVPDNPRQAYALTYQMLWYYKTIFERNSLLSEDLKNMFEELKLITDKYDKVIEWKKTISLK